MRFPLAGWSRRERILLALCTMSLAASLSALLGLGGVSVAQRGDKVVSGEIANNTIRSVDVRNRTLRASDANIYEVSSPAVSVPPGRVGGAAAACIGNDMVLGGGGTFGAGQGEEIDTSYPVETNSGWQWQFSGTNSSSHEAFIQAYAICMAN